MEKVSELLDSDVLIHALNGTNKVATDLLTIEGNFAISTIAWIEVMAGSNLENQSQIRNFLAYFKLIEIDQKIAEECVRVRKTMRLKLPDALIYSTALATGRTLVSFNSRDFPANTPSVRILRFGVKE